MAFLSSLKKVASSVLGAGNPIISLANTVSSVKPIVQSVVKPVSPKPVAQSTVKPTTINQSLPMSTQKPITPNLSMNLSDIGGNAGTKTTTTSMQLLKAANCRLSNGYAPNIWIAGEKSSGKSHAGRSLSDALGLKLYVMGTLSMEHQAIGFVDGAGKYHSTPFVECFRNGGVILMDEIDSYEAAPTLALNGPLANNYMYLPSGEFVERHKDCIIIGGANTWGLGATSDFIGRNKLDAAFLSRFPVKLTWNIDVALEQQISGNKKWAERVQAARARAKAKGLKIGIDARHTTAGAALIAGGFSFDEAAEMTYLAELSAEQRKMVEGV